MKARAMGLGLILLTAGCSKSSPVAPPIVPGPRVLNVLFIEAPASIQPGATTQLRATALYTNGEREDVSARAAWTSTDPAVVQISDAGLATAAQPGESRVQAEFEQRRATVIVLVLPANTWRLIGRVSDGGFPIENARVEVVSGTGAGLAVTTDGGGMFKFYGVAGPLQLRATASGHHSRTRDVTVNGSSNLGTIVLDPLSVIEVNGEWTLTIDAAASCTSLPDVARRRSYRASVQRTGTSVSVTVGEATFVSNANWFWGRLNGDAIQFDFTGYYSDFAVTERIDSTTTYSLGGQAAGRATASSITATLTDGIVVMQAGQPPTLCGSAQLAFVRR